MSHSVVGVVDNSYQKEKPKRAGGTVKIWYCDVDGFTFSTGFQKKYDQGEHIDIEVEKKFGEWQFKADGGRGLPSAASAPAAVPRSGGGGFTPKSKGSFPVDPKDGQMSIIRQSSMNRAVEAMETMITHGLIKVDNRDEYMDALINIALEITDFSSGNDITKLKAAMKEVANG